MFYTLTGTLYDRFANTPNTKVAIVHLVNFCDDRLSENQNYATMRRLKIFDENKSIRDLNMQASQYLNDRGCILFHQVLKSLEERKEQMEIVSEGVSENSKPYHTTCSSCNCSFSINHCRHILYLRYHSSEIGEKIFDKNLFRQRYHLLVEKDVVNDELLMDVDRELSSVSPAVVFDSNTKPNKTLPYINLITPLMVNLANIISYHLTENLLSYVNEISSLERRARKGYSLLSSAKQDREKTDEDVEEGKENKRPILNFKEKITWKGGN